VTDDGSEYFPTVVSAICRRCHKPVPMGSDTTPPEGIARH
jgi:hypothetical protein